VPDFILEKNKQKIRNGSFIGYALFADISGFTNFTEEMMKNRREGAETVK